MSEETVDVVDENDAVIGKEPRDAVIMKRLRHRSAFFIVQNSRREILITRRSKNLRVDPGLYEIPGGMVASGESYEETAKREIFEEIGIRDAKLSFLFKIPYEDDEKKQMMAVFLCKFDGKIIPQKDEIDCYFFIEVVGLKDMIIKNPESFCKNRIQIIERFIGEKII